jgi:hypothetical protein
LGFLSGLVLLSIAGLDSDPAMAPSRSAVSGVLAAILFFYSFEFVGIFIRIYRSGNTVRK